MIQIFTDTFDGTFTDKWVDRSYNSSSGYVNGKLALIFTTQSGGTSGANALLKDYLTADTVYTVEFDWYPLPASSWYNDNLGNADHIISFLRPFVSEPIEPNYNTALWNYHKVTSDRVDVHLRSTLSGLINVGATQVAFSYGSQHAVKIELDIPGNLISLWMDGNFIGSSAINVDWVGGKMMINHHWHSYSNSNLAMTIDNYSISVPGDPPSPPSTRRPIVFICT